MTNVSIPKDGPLPEGAWANWSRGQTATPKTTGKVSGASEIADVLKQTQGPVRIAGSGHSFTPLVASDGAIISLDQESVMARVDPETLIATLPAGRRIHDLSKDLHQQGYAFRNLGDIDVQTLAGATATGTHGTGRELQSLSAEIRGVTIVNGRGEEVDLPTELIPAAQVSLGSLGIITTAKVNVVPSYKLHRKTWVEPVEDLIAKAESRWQTHRNFEFFYIPFSGYGIGISHDLTDASETPRKPSDDDEATMGLKRLRDHAGWNKWLRRKLLSGAMKKVPPEDTIGTSWQLLASERNVRFNEMEYHLPVDGALDAFAEVIEWIETNRTDIWFPIEVRRTAGDDGWLSPFQGAPRISIAVHAYYKEDYDWFFEGIEPIFRKAGGRPHWGKLHSLKAGDLEALYPDFQRFQKVRREMDPDGRFLTPYMAALLGETVDA